MPFIFIHGVNTRRNDKYDKNLTARNELIQRLLLNPLAEKDPRFQNMKIVSPYWGEYGVDDKRVLNSLPEDKFFEYLGGNTPETPQSDLELQYLLANSETEASPLESLGGNDQQIKTVAAKDLTLFIETVLSPIIFSEMNLTDEAEEDPHREGVLQALLAVAGWEIATDDDVKQEVETAGSEAEVIELLTEQIQERFRELVLSSNLVSPQDISSDDKGLEWLGSKPLPRWLEESLDTIGELFNRAINFPRRILTIGVLNIFRQKLHGEASRFLGDVFVYLKERGDSDSPGSIIATILNDIKKALEDHPDEPLIVMTHSMGGNILYDILTHYQTNLRVDVWVSVGGQVGLFEDMKIFQASGTNIGTDGKVESFKGQVGYWLNVYDPADIFSFKAANNFADVQDEVYITGASLLSSHDAYFRRQSFYKRLYPYIEKALLS